MDTIIDMGLRKKSRGGTSRSMMDMVLMRHSCILVLGKRGYWLDLAMEMELVIRRSFGA